MMGDFKKEKLMFMEMVNTENGFELKTSFYEETLRSALLAHAKSVEWVMWEHLIEVMPDDLLDRIKRRCTKEQVRRRSTK